MLGVELVVFAVLLIMLSIAVLPYNQPVCSLIYIVLALEPVYY
jgi:hypothetical protein